MFRLVWERVCTSSRCNLFVKVYLRLRVWETITAGLIMVIVCLPEFSVCDHFI